MQTAPTVHQWTIAGCEDQTIYGNTHLPAPLEKPRGVLVLCHGFKGYKDYGFFPQLAHRAAGRGLVAHRFNFSHSGMTDCTETFERPDLFERDTWNKQIHDLGCVLAMSHRGQLPPDAGGWARDELAHLPTVIFGHSRGGVAALLAAARAFARDAAASAAEAWPPSAGVVLAATPAKACHISDEQRQLLHEQGFIESPSARTGQVLRLGLPWLQEIEAAPEQFDLLAAVAALRCPLLIVHGDEDATVPVAQARQLADAAGTSAELEIIPGGQHNFNAPSTLPLDTQTPPLTRRFIDVVVDFAVRCAARKNPPR